MIMLLKLRSSLLVLIVFVLSVMVASKPTFRHHRRGDSKLGATKNLRPLKQYNIRQHPTKRLVEVATIPKPSNKPSIPIPFLIDTKTSDADGISAILHNLPGSGAVIPSNIISSSTGTPLDNVKNILGLFGSQVNPPSAQTLNVDSPAVPSSGKPYTGSTKVDPINGILTGNEILDSKWVDHNVVVSKTN